MCVIRWPFLLEVRGPNVQCPLTYLLISCNILADPCVHILHCFAFKNVNACWILHITSKHNCCFIYLNDEANHFFIIPYLIVTRLSLIILDFLIFLCAVSAYLILQYVKSKLEMQETANSRIGSQTICWRYLAGLAMFILAIFPLLWVLLESFNSKHRRFFSPQRCRWTRNVPASYCALQQITTWLDFALFASRLLFDWTAFSFVLLLFNLLELHKNGYWGDCIF